jgi:hypothetical protein
LFEKKPYATAIILAYREIFLKSEVGDIAFSRRRTLPDGRVPDMSG